MQLYQFEKYTLKWKKSLEKNIVYENVYRSLYNFTPLLKV